MIKRRFFRLEHGGGDDASDSSISSSDSEPEAVATEESEDDVEEVNEDGSCSTSSGYVSEDSSVNEIDADSPDLPSYEEDENGNEKQTLIESRLPDNCTSGAAEPQSDISLVKESLPSDIPICILKCKSVFKCRICPRVVCLNEETLKSHLKSKRHARSEKLLNEGRLKIMLNSNGDIENSGSLTESPPRVPAFPQENRRRKNKSQPRSNKKGNQHLNFQMKR